MSDTAVIAKDARRPVPLASAASLLARICEDIDEGAPLTDVVKRAFADTRAELAHSVDQHITFKRACDGLIGAAKEAEEAWRAKRKQIEAVLEAFKAEVKATIEAEPNLPYQGRYGHLRLQKNGGKAKLVTKFLIREERTISNIIDPQVVELFEIAPEFIETVTVTRLNTEAVRVALKTGPLPWAELENGVHVRYE